MKRLLYFPILVLLFFAQGCVKEEDNLFDGSSAERMAAALAEYKTVLTGASNGWLLEYYPEEGYAIGGYSFICQFNQDGSMIVSSEIADTDWKESSQYSLKSNQGPVLAFDTYNAIMHNFAAPSGSDVNGSSADYEFVMTSVSSERIEMKGARYGNKAFMSPLPIGQDWQTYLNQVIDISDQSSFGTYRLLVNSLDVGSVTQTDRTFAFKYANGSDTETANTSFVYTSTGLTFYEPTSLLGKSFQHFIWDAANNQFVCADPGVDVKIVVDLPDNYLYYADYLGTWTMKGNAGNLTKTLTIEQEVKNKSFRVKGLAFDFIMTYNRLDGSVSIVTQQVGTYNGNLVYFVPWDSSAGYLVRGTGIGMNSVWNGSMDNLVLSFVDNRVWLTYTVRGFLFYQYTAAGASAGAYTAADYRFYNFTLTKQ